MLMLVEHEARLPEDKSLGKCSQISNTSCLLRQTGQTQIRQLLKKQSDQGLPCLLF